jgi:DNA-binding transcriptional regulator YiaG
MSQAQPARVGRAAAAEQHLANLRAGLVAFYEQAAATIEGIEDPQVAFEVATHHQAEVRALHEREWARASQVRAQQVVRIREAEKLSLAKLADLVGLSKSRVAQLVDQADQLAEQAKEPEEATP